MPIKAENRHHYGKAWRELRARILDRAKHRCECSGECGEVHVGDDFATPICGAPNGVWILRPVDSEAAVTPHRFQFVQNNGQHDHYACLCGCMIRVWRHGCGWWMASRKGVDHYLRDDRHMQAVLATTDARDALERCGFAGIKGVRQTDRPTNPVHNSRPSVRYTAERYRREAASRK